MTGRLITLGASPCKHVHKAELMPASAMPHMAPGQPEVAKHALIERELLCHGCHQGLQRLVEQRPKWHLTTFEERDLL